MDYKCIYSIYPNLEGIQKDGTFKYQISFQEKKIYEINCLLKNKILFYKNVLLYKYIYLNIDINQDSYVKQVIQKYILSKLKPKYKIIIYKSVNEQESTYYYYFYRDENYNELLKYIYTLKYINEQDFENNYTKNMNIFIKYMAVQLYLCKLKFMNNVPNTDFFIAIFFRFYILALKDEIIKKYGVNVILDFSNYHSIYLFLKEKNYVSIFYKKLKKEITQEYNKFKKVMKDKENIIFNEIPKMISIDDLNFKVNLKKLNLTENNITKIKKNINIFKNN
jgi:hypothetical protein